MARIIREAEGSPFYAPLSSLPGDAATVPEAIARAAVAVAKEVKARVIICFTETGSTARFVSKARPRQPIIAFCPNEATRRKLSMYWGVMPVAIEKLRDSDAMVERANAYVLEQGLGVAGDKMVAVFGAPIGVSGSTNSVRVRVLG